MLHGLVVSGDSVTAYGLAVEHTLNDLVQWNGNDGATYFYQSELPWVPPLPAWLGVPLGTVLGARARVPIPCLPRPLPQCDPVPSPRCPPLPPPCSYDVDPIWGNKGYVGYRVGSSVTTHTCVGCGVYHYFRCVGWAALSR